MMDHEHHQRRLGELLDTTAPSFEPVTIDQLDRLRRQRPVRRHAASLGAVAVVLAVVAGLLLANSLRSQPHRTGALPTPTIAPPPTAARLDQLANSAPCRLTVQDRHPAEAAQVAKFTAVAAIECRTEIRSYPGQGEWQVLERRVATAGLAAVVAALTRPDQHASSGNVCAGLGYGPLLILLADNAGHYLHPRPPTDQCGAPLPAVAKALDGLRWRTVSDTRMMQTRTPASIASRCVMAWKNELYFDTQMHTPASPGGPVLTNQPNGPVRVCIYRTSTDISGGRFQRSLTLTGTKARQLRTALSRPGPSHTCPAQHAFATVWSGHNYVNVELGGCWRVQRHTNGPTGIGSADPDLVTQLLGIKH